MRLHEMQIRYFMSVYVMHFINMIYVVIVSHVRMRVKHSVCVFNYATYFYKRIFTKDCQIELRKIATSFEMNLLIYDSFWKTTQNMLIFVN